MAAALSAITGSNEQIAELAVLVGVNNDLVAQTTDTHYRLRSPITRTLQNILPYKNP